MSSKFESPLGKRWASKEMQAIFSDDSKFKTWRKLWVLLAESQKELGIEISEEQISQMKQFVGDINYEVAEKFEQETLHDVMAHIKAYCEQCPDAAAIIHLGATSSFVGDNTDIILRRSALLRVKELLISAISKMCEFAEKHKELACLSYTHFQAAQPTTLGKRATLWIQDLLFDLENINFALDRIKLLGCKGATGTGASFLSLFEQDQEKVLQLEQKIAERLGFSGVYPVTGQTYSRKIDYFTLSALSGIAQSAYKFSNDIRLMAHMKELEEPFKAGQVGSSAMAYKKNPIKSERIASLARYVMVDALNPALTASSQWFERTLDDSANRRISIPEAFLAVDAILMLVSNVIEGAVVYPKVITRHLDEEIPFMATENILMYCVKKGGDRQVLHERLRVLSTETADRLKREGGENDLLKRIADDDVFDITVDEINEIIRTGNFTGRAKEQTEEFLKVAEDVLRC